LYLVCEERTSRRAAQLLHAFHVPRSIVFVHRNDGGSVATKLTHHKLAVAT